jgi:hypothetical protein
MAPYSQKLEPPGKPGRFMGCGVALAEGRRMQYVNQDYRIRVYDVSYES